MSDPGWTLDDAEALAAEFPDTFLIAPMATRANLRPGEYAKLIFRFDTADDPPEGAVERMWTVVFVNDSGRYAGRLVNQPLATPADARLHLGAEITYEARHIINWEDADARSLEYFEDPSREF